MSLIHIPRTNRPPFLQRSKAKKAYRDQRVVSELWKMQQHKCCYCESLIPEKGHAKAVEHFRPQALFPSKRNEWKNLLLACAQCNGLKSDEFPVVVLGCDDTVKVVQARQEDSGRPAILDPCDTDIDPEKHLDFVLELTDDFCGLIRARNVKGKKSNLGQKTIDIIGLFDDYYRGKYAAFIRCMYRETTRLLDARDTRNAQGLTESRRQFEQWMSAGNESAGVARAFVRSKGLTRLGVGMPGGDT